MAVAELLKNMSVDTPIPIFINNDPDIFMSNSYVHGYHGYINVWNAIINDSVHCKNKEDNEFDTTAVTLKKKKLLDTFHYIYQEHFILFWKLPGSNISATVTSKRVNRGARDSCGIQVLWRQKSSDLGENTN